MQTGKLAWNLNRKNSSYDKKGQFSFSNSPAKKDTAESFLSDACKREYGCQSSFHDCI